MSLMDEIIGGGSGAARDPLFPHAPVGWTPALAIESARREGMELGEEHWEALRALHEYYAKHELTAVNLRGLHDALDEKQRARLIEMLEKGVFHA